MRCLSCGLKMADAPAYPAAGACPRCGQPLGRSTAAYPPPEGGSPGQPHFTLPTLTAVNVPPIRGNVQKRVDAHGELHRQPPYPAVAETPSSRAPLIVGVLSIAIVVALLLGAGLVWRGSLKAGPTHLATENIPRSTVHTVAGTATTSAIPGAILYQSSLEGVAGGWINVSHCSYSAGGYDITGAYLCYAPVTQQGDVDITVTAKQLSGPYSLLYGIVFRASGKGDYYLFGIDGNGKWTVAKLSNNSSSYLIQPQLNAAVKAGLNQINTLEVKTTGSHFEFFVNGIQVGQTVDSSYSIGLIGLTSEDGVEIAYTNFSVVKPYTH